MGRKKRRWGRVVLAGLVVAAGVVAFTVWKDRQPPEAASDLAAFDEIDLGPFQGDVVDVGNGRAGLLPVVARRDGGQSRLALINPLASTVIDAGRIPIEGELPDVYPTASDRFVTMVVPICKGGLVEADTGLECKEEQAQLFVAYDIAGRRWQTVPLEPPPGSRYELVDTDGATAVFREPGIDGGPDHWATVALDQALDLGEFTTEKPEIRPNGTQERMGHMDGFGWKTQVNEEAKGISTTWTGTTDGKPDTVVIDLPPERVVRGAGNCIAILTREGERLENLHGLCAT